MVASYVVFILIGFTLMVDCLPQNNGGVRNPAGSRPSSVQDITTTEAAPTRLPTADPANPLVFTVSCPCQFTRQYSPVCGTDGQTYGNAGVLQCAARCGKKVTQYLAGACP